jgi:IS30 family transposase
MAEGEELGSNLLHVAPGTPASSAGRGSWQRRAKGQTVTFDNGTEFARHRALHSLAIDTFFCDPYAPWQKGGIENAIGRMRRFMPRKTDLATLSNRRL